MSPESKKLLSQFATALSSETIYGESDTASMKRCREYSAKTEVARKALEARIESLEGATQVRAVPTDTQIIAALHANGIDTCPSKYGFDAVQVSATSVPNLRNVLVTLAAEPGKADAANAGGITPAVTEITDTAARTLIDFIYERIGFIDRDVLIGEVRRIVIGCMNASYSAGVRGQIPATIAAGQEADNAKDLLDALKLIAAEAAEGAGSTGPAGWMGAIARVAIAKAIGSAAMAAAPSSEKGGAA